MPHLPSPERVDAISHLCLDASRIMEDDSPALVLRLPSTAAEIEAPLATVRRAGEDLVALAKAAEVLLRRSSDAL